MTTEAKIDSNMSGTDQSDNLSAATYSLLQTLKDSRDYIQNLEVRNTELHADSRAYDLLRLAIYSMSSDRQLHAAGSGTWGWHLSRLDQLIEALETKIKQDAKKKPAAEPPASDSEVDEREMVNAKA